MPHAERANTASFLEECITYIQGLQQRIADLEQQQAGVGGGAANALGQIAPASAAAVAAGLYSMPGVAAAAPKPAAAADQVKHSACARDAAGSRGARAALTGLLSLQRPARSLIRPSAVCQRDWGCRGERRFCWSAS